MLRKGIYAGLGYPVSLEERLALIQAAGFDYVCLNFEKNAERNEGAWEEQLRLSQKHRMPVHAVHLTGSGMNAIWSDEGEAVTDRLIGELHQLKKLGLSLGVAHVTWGLTPPAEPSLSALRRFERIADTAEALGVYLAFENSAFAESLRYVLDQIKSPFIGFCYDSGHENAFTPKAELLSSYGDWLLEMHLHDNDGFSDQHRPPFEGTIDWQETVNKLRKTKVGSSMVTLETARQPEMSLEELLERSYQAALKLANYNIKEEEI